MGRKNEELAQRVFWCFIKGGYSGHSGLEALGRGTQDDMSICTPESIVGNRDVLLASWPRSGGCRDLSC